MYESDEELHRAIGRKVKSLRLHNRLTIGQLGQRCGVSKSMLSMIEAGRRTPSIRLLMRIAASLDVPVTELLEEVEHPGAATVLRKESQTTEALSREVAVGVVKHLAEMNWSNLFIRLYQYELEDFPKPPAIFQHPGFWIVLVVKGTIDFDVGGEHRRLGPGDTICCNAEIPHSMVKVVDGPLRMIGIQAWAHERP